MNFIGECRENRLPLWECPPFLFIVMGIVNIVTVVSIYIFAERLVAEPEIAALIVLFIALLIFAVGNFLIAGFNKVVEANRIKTEFLNMVSHQLRTPLAIFKWALELLGQEQKTLSQQQKEYIALLRDNNERMIRLVGLLLDVSRIEARRFVLRRSPVSLGELTGEVVKSLKAEREALRTLIRFEGQKGAMVLGDAERLRMVVQNLLDNAIRYSFAGGEIIITISDMGQGVAEWRIRDHGAGIPAGQQKHIFQKFFRGESGRFPQPQGTGLGLYIARVVIAELGGEMGFESQEGKGSTFWFRLPIYK
ncbi:MAG: HAMP domain-containing histidine kinase [Candidatus Sungbacteria bacterium]|nr:HAMP domain-containing histidine kinase [Candidatus Sungbacteria bacterium]